MTNQNTHLNIDTTLSGNLIKSKENYAKVQLYTHQAMVADDKGLIHGGFAFSAADFAAMCAVNDPNVVLAKAQTTFIAPVKVGQVIIFEANILTNNGKKQTVNVEGKVENKLVFKGIFTTAVLKKHIFDI